MNLTDLQTFLWVAEKGSLTGAAKELGLPKSTVSRRITRLEDELGLSLLSRSGRRVALTSVGRRLQERTAASIGEIRAVERELIEAFDEPTGTLRMTAPYDIGATQWFARLLTGYTRRYAHVDVEVDLTNRAVDLVDEGLDVALRAGVDESSGLVTRRLATIDGGLYASPAYVKQRGSPEDAAALREHACVSHTSFGDSQHWSVRDPDGTRHEVPVRSVLTTNDVNLVLNTILEGTGIGPLPSVAAQRFEAAGQLVSVLSGWGFGEGAFFLAWPESRHLSPRVRAFVDHAVGYVEEHGFLK